jgi:prevent-host-death family protein
MRASAKELRSKSSQILDAVLRGEDVVITYRGRELARMIRYDKARPPRGNMQALFGIWADHRLVADVDRYVRDLRKGRF